MKKNIFTKRNIKATLKRIWKGNEIVYGYLGIVILFLFVASIFFSSNNDKMHASPATQQPSKIDKPYYQPPSWSYSINNKKSKSIIL